MVAIDKHFELLRVKTKAIEEMTNAFWIKEYVDGKFYMRYLNKRYEELFLIPNGKNTIDYINKSDFDIWPHEIAGMFEGNDFKCYNTKKDIVFVEKYMSGGVELRRYFKKIYYKDYATGKEYIIGWAIDI